MDAALALGIIGSVTGIASGVWGVLAWHIERRDRRADLAEERRIREDAAELAHRRFALELEDREARLAAEITAAPSGFRPASGTREFDFELRNLGPSIARHVRAWLEAYIDGEPRVISDRPEIHLGVDEVRTVQVRVSDRLLGDGTEGAALWIEWTDYRGGPHRKRSDATVGI